MNCPGASVGRLDSWAFAAACAPPALASLVIVYGVVAFVWRSRLWLGERGPHAAVETLALDRVGIAEAVVATVALLALFAAPLPHAEGVPVAAGCLSISRKLPTRRLLGLVDWHLLVLVAGLFVVTAALTATGLPATLLDWMAAGGRHPSVLEVIAPVVVIGSNSIGNVPLVVLLLGIVSDPSVETLYALALLSTLAGTLLSTGSRANIIAVERAAEVGLKIELVEHARTGVPITVASLGLTLLWLTIGAGCALACRL